MPKTAETVANLIRRQIIRGELGEGDALPLESQVMTDLGVSRRSVREALRILETENLISVVRGSRQGARVHLPQTGSASRYAGFVLQAQGTTIADIYEARLAIEPYVVRRLAETRPDGAVQRLRAEITALKLLVEQHRLREFMIAIAEFHRLLVELSGMRTMLFLTRMLQDVVARYQVRLMQTGELPETVHQKAALVGIGSFRKLVDLIEAGEGEKAEAHWRLHIVNANKAWLPDGYQNLVIDMLE